ncbi:MAG: hypothetical protein VXW32_04605 [Myxococcota bacterium]|nr:hypothetical protein [Myxococcota bacterium]
MQRFLPHLLLSSLLVACNADDNTNGPDTGENVESVPLTETLRSDLVSADYGLLAATDLTVDFVVLREAGSAFEFIERNFASWGRSILDGQPAQFTDCIDADSTTESSRNFQLRNCFIGAERSRKLNGSGTVSFSGASMVVDLDWSFKMGSTVELTGKYVATWDDLFRNSLADGLLDMEIVYLGNTYSGRKFVVEGGSVDVSDRPELPPNYIFPAEGDPDSGVTITWEGRDDVIHWGMSLEINEENSRYSGSLWGNYITAGGKVVAIESGTVEESTGNKVTTSIEGSFSEGSTVVTISPLKATWNSQADSFEGELGFYAEQQSELTLSTWTSPLKLMAYTINPLTISADDGQLTLNGAVEFGFQTENEEQEQEETWLFGTCEDLQLHRTEATPQKGSCDFANAAATTLRVFFQETDENGDHVLVDDGSEEWICRNMTTGDESEAGPVSSDPNSCP